MFVAKNILSNQLVMINVENVHEIAESLKQVWNIDLDNLEIWKFWELPEKSFRIIPNVSFDIIEE